MCTGLAHTRILSNVSSCLSPPRSSVGLTHTYFVAPLPCHLCPCLPMGQPGAENSTGPLTLRPLTVVQVCHCDLSWLQCKLLQTCLLALNWPIKSPRGKPALVTPWAKYKVWIQFPVAASEVCACSLIFLSVISRFPVYLQYLSVLKPQTFILWSCHQSYVRVKSDSEITQDTSHSHIQHTPRWIPASALWSRFLVAAMESSCQAGDAEV